MSLSRAISESSTKPEGSPFEILLEPIGTYSISLHRQNYSVSVMLNDDISFFRFKSKFFPEFRMRQLNQRFRTFAYGFST